MSEEYPFTMSPDEASSLVIMNQIGFAVGAVLSSHLMDIVGRKWTLILTSLPMVVSFLMICLCDYAGILLYIARVLGGIGEASATGIVGIYIAEIASPLHRGKLVCCINVAYILATILISIYGYYLSIRTTALICLAFPIIFLLIFPSMPESPYYLLMKNSPEEARQCLRLLRRREDIEEEAVSLQADVDRQMSERGGYKELFMVPTNRRAIFLLLGVKFFHLGTGYNAIAAYMQVFLNNEGLSPVWGMFVILIFCVFIYIGGSFLVDKLGRRKLSIISASANSCSLFAISVLLILMDSFQFSLSWPLLVSLIAYFICFSGMAIAINIYATEMFSNSVKAEGTAVNMVCHSLGSMLTTKYYQFAGDHVAVFLPFLTFGIITAVGVSFFAFVMPETKGQTLEGIQVNLKSKV